MGDSEELRKIGVDVLTYRMTRDIRTAIFPDLSGTILYPAYGLVSVSGKAYRGQRQFI